MKSVHVILSFAALWAFATADVSHILSQYSTTTTSTPPPPPHPYIFSYTAGRFPGHTDRAHSEISDGSGTIRGAFSYVDPRGEVRTVEYVADRDGFYPSLSHPIDTPEETEAVRRASARHFNEYNQIAASHAALNAAPTVEAATPRDTQAVAFAKQKHTELFERIAAQHAKIAAQREAERLAFEATSVPNEIDSTAFNHR